MIASEAEAPKEMLYTFFEAPFAIDAGRSFYSTSELTQPAAPFPQGSREGIDRLRRLSESLSKREPRNTSLHLKISRPFARVCGRDPVALQLTIGMLESVRVSGW